MKGLRLPWLLISALFCAFLNLQGEPAWAKGIVDTLPRIKPSVVGIGSFDAVRTPRVRMTGTGFVVGDGLTVVTNAHVPPTDLDLAHKETLVILDRKGSQVEVRSARIAAEDTDHDLLLLRISGKPLPALKLGDSDRAREGETLYFTGYPLGAILGLYPATNRAGLAAVAPIYSPPMTSRGLTPELIMRAREPYLIFQLDAVAYPGNSGSPLYDPDTGEVLGVINAVFVKGAKENAITHPSGISYAIPSNYIRALLQKYADKP